ncbi:hypothetical protein [Palleronia caenipelagi]|uniref:PH domain-containing protein n=1 Tax=Palleronia caenipelagi TaxID=2489174 RepID=A0A547Q5D5_9RHOB|nr:hypothetical protein [Palleronia caenipelagi]TRD21578.1 hypothetical protein FEV53_08850 [Palleronia caenipelagi]
MTEPHSDLLASLNPSPARRYLAAGVFLGLGLILMTVAMKPAEGEAVGRIALVVMGLASLGAGWAVWRASSRALYLTSEALIQSDGQVVAPLSQIAGVERGVFAMKPSNGFVLRLREPLPRHWSPGMWWRFGKRVGVGGITAPAEGKAMADILALRLAEQND